MCLCVSCGFHNKWLLFPSTELADWYLCFRHVFCEVGAELLIVFNLLYNDEIIHFHLHNHLYFPTFHVFTKLPLPGWAGAVPSNKIFCVLVINARVLFSLFTVLLISVAISHQFITVWAWVRSQGGLCRFCCWLCGTGTGFSPNTLVPHPLFIISSMLYTYIR